MLTLNVTVTVLQPGWDKVITVRVQFACFCSFTYKPPYVSYIALKLTTVMQRMPNLQQAHCTIVFAIMYHVYIHL